MLGYTYKYGTTETTMVHFGPITAMTDGASQLAAEKAAYKIARLM